MGRTGRNQRVSLMADSPAPRRVARACRTAAARFARDRRGAAIAYFGLLLPLLLGAAGLGIDVGASYSARQRAQTQAEAAAMAAALELNKASPRATITSAATADATSNGLDTARGDRLTVNIPPAQGGYAGDAKAAEAVVQSSVQQILAPFVGGASTVVVAARAVARVVRTDACVWAL